MSEPNEKKAEKIILSTKCAEMNDIIIKWSEKKNATFQCKNQIIKLQ